MKILYVIAPPSIKYDSQKYFIKCLLKYCTEKGYGLDIIGPGTLPQELEFTNIKLYPVDDKGMYKFVSGSGGFFKYTTRVGFEIVKELANVLDKHGFYKFIMVGEMAFCLPFQMVDLDVAYYTHVDLSAVGNKFMEELMKKTLEGKIVFVTQAQFNKMRFSFLQDTNFVVAPIPIQDFPVLDIVPSGDIVYSGTGSIGSELDKILEYTKEEGSKWHVILYGPTDMERPVVEGLRRQGVTVLGRMERTKYLDYIQKFKCYVSFSDVETFGLRILEAAMVMPVVIWNRSVLTAMYKGVFEEFQGLRDLLLLVKKYEDPIERQSQVKNQREFIQKIQSTLSFSNGLDEIPRQLQHLYHPLERTLNMIKLNDSKIAKWDIYSLQRLYQVLDDEMQVKLQNIVSSPLVNLF